MSHGIAPKRRLNRRQWALVLIALAAVLMFVNSAVTRVQVIEHGSETVCGYRWWSAAFSGLAAGSVAAGGLLFMSARIGWARWLGILPVLMGGLVGLFAYDTATVQLVITPTGLVVPGYGFWPRPYERLAFDEVGGVTIQRDDQTMTFHRKDRTKVTVPAGDLVKAAMPQLVKALDARGVGMVED